jgi:moderate conductance mechanosensitive channel
VHLLSSPPVTPSSTLAQEENDGLEPRLQDAEQGLADLINRVVPEELEFLVENLVSPGLMIVFILFLGLVATGIARRGISRTAERMKSDDGVGRRLKTKVAGGKRPTAAEQMRRAQRADALGALARSVATTVIWVIVVTMALGQLGIQLGPLIAGAGIVGVALGFGAQDLVKDFLSGVFMLIEDQFGVGDIIDAGEAAGVVEGISLRSTRVRDIDGTLWHIPNGEIRRVGNMSQEFARAMLDIGVAYGADVDAAADIIERVAVEMSSEPDYENVFLDVPEILGVERLGTDSVDIRLLIKTQPAKQWAVSRELRRRIKNAFDAAGVEIPFPQRTVWLRTEAPVALGDAEAAPFEAPKPDEDTKRRAVVASKRGDTGVRDEMADMLPDEPEEVGGQPDPEED